MKINENGLEQYPKSTIIFGNLIMLLWIVLGTIAAWFVSAVVALIYFLSAIILVFIVLRRLICVNCYYYDKWCPIGWGKLAALLFKKGDMEKFRGCIGAKIAPMVYGIFTLIPLILVAYSFWQEFTVFKLVIFISILAIGYYSGTISRKKSCANCKMNLECPGSAVK